MGFILTLLELSNLAYYYTCYLVEKPSLHQEKWKNLQGHRKNTSIEKRRMESPQHGIKSSNIPHHNRGYLHTPKDPFIPLKACNPVHNKNTSIRTLPLSHKGRLKRTSSNHHLCYKPTNPEAYSETIPDRTSCQSPNI